MQKRRLMPIIAGAMCTALLMAGCAHFRKSGGQMDDPSIHYKQGMKYWNDKKYAQAEDEFKLAQSLDSNYALAYAGLALTTAQAAKTAGDVETAEKGFKEALKLADKAQSLGRKIPGVFIAKAIVITMKNEGKDAKTWLGEVEKEYNKALKLKPKNAEALYRRGYCYKNAYEFSKAADDFRKVLDLKKGFATQAKKQLEIVQKIERTGPCTDVGKKIVLVEQLRRADIAALFVLELHIDKLIGKKPPDDSSPDFQVSGDTLETAPDSIVSMAEVTDIDGHWAKTYIMDIVKHGIRGLELYPDHTFHPDRLVNRGEFALMVQDVLIAVTGDKDLAAKYSGTESPFPDVNLSHPAYNAICTAVGRGVMDAGMNGEFGPNKPISGPDALLTIRNCRFLWLH